MLTGIQKPVSRHCLGLRGSDVPLLAYVESGQLAELASYVAAPACLQSPDSGTPHLYPEDRI